MSKYAFARLLAEAAGEDEDLKAVQKWERTLDRWTQETSPSNPSMEKAVVIAAVLGGEPEDWRDRIERPTLERIRRELAGLEGQAAELRRRLDEAERGGEAPAPPGSE